MRDVFLGRKGEKAMIGVLNNETQLGFDRV